MFLVFKYNIYADIKYALSSKHRANKYSLPWILYCSQTCRNYRQNVNMEFQIELRVKKYYIFGRLPKIIYFNEYVTNPAGHFKFNIRSGVLNVSFCYSKFG